MCNKIRHLLLAQSSFYVWIILVDLMLKSFIDWWKVFSVTSETTVGLEKLGG